MGKPIHGAPTPVDVPRDMQEVSPIYCDLKVGDKVIFTNDYGLKFERIVRGFASKPHGERFIYTATDAWWFPDRRESLSLVS